MVWSSASTDPGGLAVSGADALRVLLFLWLVGAPSWFHGWHAVLLVWCPVNTLALMYYGLCLHVACPTCSHFDGHAAGVPVMPCLLISVSLSFYKSGTLLVHVGC